MQTEETQREEVRSPFEEIKEMNPARATNILLSAANAAQRAGALTVRDSVLVAAAAEFLTNYINQQIQGEER
jgi:hypothetical protein